MISAIGIDRAQHVRDGRDGHQLRARAEQLVQRVQSQQAVVGQWGCGEHGPASLGQLLPGHEVRVVLHLGEQNLVAGAHVGVAPTACHQVDACGRAVGEDDLLEAGASMKAAHLLPRGVVQFTASSANGWMPRCTLA